MTESMRAFLAQRSAEVKAGGHKRPIDALMRRMMEVPDPSKLEHRPPNVPPDTPDGDKPTTRRSRKVGGYTP